MGQPNCTYHCRVVWHVMLKCGLRSVSEVNPFWYVDFGLRLWQVSYHLPRQFLFLGFAVQSWLQFSNIPDTTSCRESPSFHVLHDLGDPGSCSIYSCQIFQCKWKLNSQALENQNCFKICRSYLKRWTLAIYNCTFIALINVSSTVSWDHVRQNNL